MGNPQNRIASPDGDATRTPRDCLCVVASGALQYILEGMAVPCPYHLSHSFFKWV
ncbi:hypothetical protein FDUTEX481_00851 [Tolypothrix sp. PCC 7601]|nr:hypothetical protein FDUTEX481_00851 [Tolypothrix sp. PCC 7601]